MPKLFIHVLNSEFQSRDEGADYKRVEDAMALGVRSALGIVVDEINGGKSTAAVDICVEDEDGTSVLRSVVAVSVSTLLAERRATPMPIA